MSFRILLLVFLLICLGHKILAQGEIEDQLMYNRNERTLSPMLNTNGWGFNLRLGKRIDGYRKWLLDFDFATIKHPKEIKIHIDNTKSRKRYVLGKLNCFYSLRFAYGRQKEIFSKFDKGGIAIKYFITAGPSIGLLKPVYYEIDTRDSLVPVIIQKYDPSIHGKILGNASYFEGIDETSLVPGIFVKYAYSFEYSKQSTFINALETGIIAEGFIKKIPIMATEENNQYFFTLFISYRFGKTYGGIKKE